MIILIDGPEKSGKTTLIQNVRDGLNARVRHWGPVDPDDRVYLEPLIQDSLSKDWVIWDRGWPSEHVYGTLLNRVRRLSNDPFLGEWLYGRALMTTGIRIMLLPDTWVHADTRRDNSDLAVSSLEEVKLYSRYAQDFGYRQLINDYTKSSLQFNVKSIIKMAAYCLEQPWYGDIQLPNYAGPLDARVIFVGESRNPTSNFPGSYLPFTTPFTMAIARKIGPRALRFGWTNVEDVPLEFLQNRFVVGCGAEAEKWLSGITPRCTIPHPAWLYRFHTEAVIEKSLMVDKFLKTLGGM